MVNLENRKVLKYLFYAGLVIAVLADFLMHREKIELPWDAVPGFNAMYGFLSTILLIIVSRAAGYVLLKREDYYD